MKKLLIKLMMVLALVGLTVQVTSCKSKNNQGDTELVDNADVAKIEAEDDFGGSPDTTTDSTVTDESLQAALGEAPTADPSTTETPVGDAPPPEIAAAPQLDELTLSDGSTAPAPSVDAGTDPNANLTTDPAMAEATGISETPIVETPQENPILADNTPILTPEQTSSEVTPVSAPVTPKSSLKKVSDLVPYQEGEGWVNTVYIVRPGDNLKKISQKIYGSDKSDDLKKINPQLKSRGPKKGEKLLYVSPNRPMDSSKMITFYEDTGAMPETYVAQKGDDIKKLAKKLIGSSEGWQELWSTNPVESKGKLAEGEIIRYYAPAAPAETVVKNDTAQVITDPNQLPGGNNMGINNPPPPQPPVEMAPTPQPPQDMAMNNPPPPPDMPAPPPPPPPDMNAEANLPPPPPPDLPPPPPPPAAVDEPQPPAATASVEEATGEEGAGLIFGLDQVQLTLAAVVLIGVVLLILMRVRKKKKEAELAAMSETNVI